MPQVVVARADEGLVKAGPGRLDGRTEGGGVGGDVAGDEEDGEGLALLGLRLRAPLLEPVCVREAINPVDE